MMLFMMYLFLFFFFLNNNGIFPATHFPSSAERDETKRAEKKAERVEEEILACNSSRSRDAVRPHRHQNPIQSSENGKDHEGAVAMVRSEDEQARVSGQEAPARPFAGPFPVLRNLQKGPYKLHL